MRKRHPQQDSRLRVSSFFGRVLTRATHRSPLITSAPTTFRTTVLRPRAPLLVGGTLEDDGCVVSPVFVPEDNCDTLAVGVVVGRGGEFGTVELALLTVLSPSETVPLGIVVSSLVVAADISDSVAADRAVVVLPKVVAAPVVVALTDVAFAPVCQTKRRVCVRASSIVSLLCVPEDQSITTVASSVPAAEANANVAKARATRMPTVPTGSPTPNTPTPLLFFSPVFRAKNEFDFLGIPQLFRFQLLP